MGQSEFSLIEKYFSSKTHQRKSDSTALGIGDDAAVIQIPPGQQLVVTMDTLIAGQHFPVETNPFDIAYKSLAVNVSDLVAMAATPAFFLLSLTLPEAQEEFLSEFSEGLFNAADEFGITLVGGDTCKGALSISIQASGLIAADKYITRSGAKVGDKIIVSGELGAATLGLAHMQQKIELSSTQAKHCLKSLNTPKPAVNLINLLDKFASSAIDLSDGLVGDLGHILDKSSVGAIIDRRLIPAYEALIEHNLFDYALIGGDDYQILFTVAEQDLDNLFELAGQQQQNLYIIGDIVEQGYFMIDQNELRNLSTYRGFDHFVS